MAIGSGNLILAADYNSIQSAVSNVLGTGSGDIGYGQAITSAQVVLNSLITAQHMINLKTDLDKIAFHQNNAASSAPAISVGGTILASDWANYNTSITNLNSTRLTLSASQSTTTENLVAPTFSNWNATRTHVVTITFADANAARYFFNTGSEIRIKPSQSGQASTTTKGGRWNSLFAATGTLKISAHSTSRTGTGYTPTIASSVGWYELTSSNQRIYNIIDTGTYSGNDLDVYANKNVAGTVLTVTINFNDDGTFGTIDEAVEGTTTSGVGTYRATGSYVSVAQPTVATTTTP